MALDVKCRGCNEDLNPNNITIADGCPCNSPRGVNHGLVPDDVCTCDLCDPARTGASRSNIERLYCRIGSVEADAIRLAELLRAQIGPKGGCVVCGFADITNGWHSQWCFVGKYLKMAAAPDLKKCDGCGVEGKDLKQYASAKLCVKCWWDLLPDMPGPNPANRIAELETLCVEIAAEADNLPPDFDFFVQKINKLLES